MDLNKNEEGKRGTFSFSSYRERFQQELSTREIQFLMRVFGRTSFKFFCFGLFIFGLNVILDRLMGDELLSLLFRTGLILLALLSCLPTFFMKRRYTLNPLAASKTLKNGLFSLTSFQFVASFLLLMHIYRYVHDSSSSWNYEVSSAILIAFVFGTAWLLYLIPVFVSWFLITRKQAIKLSKFVSRCYVWFMISWIATIALCFLGTGFFCSITALAVLALFSIIIFCSPIVTLYKFKATAYAIDYDNVEETKGWADYFGFVMLEQMLILAVQIMRIVVQIVGRR